MTDLSPAAQAVLDAAQFEVNAECHAPWIAAAVLRTAADRLYHAASAHMLYAIATELEGQ